MKNCSYKRVASPKGNDLVVFYYFNDLKSGPIRGVSFGGNGLMKVYSLTDAYQINT